MARTKQPADERPDEAASAEERQNDETEALIAKRDEIVAEKAVAEREQLPPTAVDQAAEAKAGDPNAPSTAQVADSSSSMVRVPDEGETEESAAERARAKAVADPANPGQPPGAVYPDRIA